MNITVPFLGKLRYSVGIPAGGESHELETITGEFAPETANFLVCIGAQLSLRDVAAGCEVKRFTLPHNAIRIWTCRASNGEKLIVSLGAKRTEKAKVRHTEISVMSERRGLRGVLPLKFELHKVEDAFKCYDLVRNCIIGPSIIEMDTGAVILYPLARRKSSGSKQQIRQVLIPKRVGASCIAACRKSGHVAVGPNSLYESVKLLDMTKEPFEAVDLEAILEKLQNAPNLESAKLKLLRFHDSRALLFGIDTANRAYMWNYKTRRLIAKFDVASVHKEVTEWVNLHIDVVHSIVLLISKGGDILPLSFSENILHLSCLAKVYEEGSGEHEALIPPWASCLGLSIHPNLNIFLPLLKIERKLPFTAAGVGKIEMRCLSFDIKDIATTAIGRKHVYFFRSHASDPSIFRLGIDTGAELENAEESRALILNFAEEGKTEFYPVLLRTYLYSSSTGKEKRLFGVLAHSKSREKANLERSDTLYIREVVTTSRETSPILKLEGVVDFVFAERHEGTPSVLYIDVSGSVFYELEVRQALQEGSSVVNNGEKEQGDSFLDKYKRIVARFETRVTRVFPTPIAGGKRLLYYSTESSSLSISSSSSDLAPSSTRDILYLQGGEDVIDVATGTFRGVHPNGAQSSRSTYFAVLTRARVLIADAHLRIVASTFPTNSFVEYPFSSVVFAGGCAVYSTDTHLYYLSMDGMTQSLCSLPFPESRIVSFVDSGTAAFWARKGGESIFYTLPVPLLEVALAGVSAYSGLLKGRDSRSSYGGFPPPAMFEKGKFRDAVRISRSLFRLLSGSDIPRYHADVGLALMKSGMGTVDGLKSQFVEDKALLALRSCRYDEALAILTEGLRAVDGNDCLEEERKKVVAIIRRIGLLMLEECQFYSALRCFTLIGEDWDAIRIAAFYLPPPAPEGGEVTESDEDRHGWVLPYIFVIVMKAIANGNMKLLNAAKYMLPSGGSLFNALRRDEEGDRSGLLDFLARNVRGEGFDRQIPFHQAIWRLICRERDVAVQKRRLGHVFGVLAARESAVEFMESILSQEFSSIKEKEKQAKTISVTSLNRCAARALEKFSEIYVFDYLREVLLKTLLEADEEMKMKEKESLAMREIMEEERSGEKEKKKEKKEKKKRKKKKGNLEDHSPSTGPDSGVSTPSIASNDGIGSLCTRLVGALSSSLERCPPQVKKLAHVVVENVKSSYGDESKDHAFCVVTRLLFSPYLQDVNKKLIRRIDFKLPKTSQETPCLHEVVSNAAATASEVMERLALGSVDLKKKEEMTLVDEIVSDDALYEEFKEYMDGICTQIVGGDENAESSPSSEATAEDGGHDRYICEVEEAKLVEFIEAELFSLSQEVAAIISEREVSDESIKNMLNWNVERATEPDSSGGGSVSAWTEKSLGISPSGGMISREEGISSWIPQVEHLEHVDDGGDELPGSPRVDGKEKGVDGDIDEEEGFKAQPDLASEFKKIQRQFTVGGFDEGWDDFSDDEDGKDSFKRDKSIKFEISEGDQHEVRSKRSEKPLAKSESFALALPPPGKSRSRNMPGAVRHKPRTLDLEDRDGKEDNMPPKPVPPPPSKGKGRRGKETEGENETAKAQPEKEAESAEGDNEEEEMDSFAEFFKGKEGGGDFEFTGNTTDAIPKEGEGIEEGKDDVNDDGEEFFEASFEDDGVWEGDDNEQKEGLDESKPQPEESNEDSFEASFDSDQDEGEVPGEPEKEENPENVEKTDASIPLEENQIHEVPDSPEEKNEKKSQGEEKAETPESELELALQDLDGKDVEGSSRHLTRALELTYEGRKNEKTSEDVALLRETVQYVILLRCVMKKPGNAGGMDKMGDEDVLYHATLLLISSSLSLRSTHKIRIMSTAAKKLNGYGYVDLAKSIIEQLSSAIPEYDGDGRIDDASGMVGDEEEGEVRELSFKCGKCGVQSSLNSMRCPIETCRAEVHFSVGSLCLLPSDEYLRCPLCLATYGVDELDVSEEDTTVCPICRIGKLRKEE